MAISDFQWAATAVATVTAAVIAATVATRNARKHPYERLKLLVEIAEKMPEDADPRGVVDAAIGEELSELRKLRSFDAKHPWLRRLQYASFPLLVAIALGWSWATNPSGPLPANGTVGVVCSLLALVIVGFFLGQMLVVLQERRSSGRSAEDKT